MGDKLPAILLYPGDWLRDPVAGCSLAAQMLWMRMMFTAHDSERYGYLQMNGAAMPPDFIARKCGSTPDQYATLLSELDAAGVPRRTPEGIIFSKRMVEDAKKRLTAYRNGKKGGNPTLKGLVNRQVNRDMKMNMGLDSSEGNEVQGQGEKPLSGCAERTRARLTERRKLK